MIAWHLMMNEDQPSPYQCSSYCELLLVFDACNLQSLSLKSGTEWRARFCNKNTDNASLVLWANHLHYAQQFLLSILSLYKTRSSCIVMQLNAPGIFQ